MSILASSPVISNPVHESCDPIVRQSDEIWWSGFQLGLDGEIEEADPDDRLTPWQRLAFRHGWEAGRKEFEAERLEFADAFDRYVDSMDNGDRWPEAELAEAFGTRGGPPEGGAE